MAPTEPTEPPERASCLRRLGEACLVVLVASLAARGLLAFGRPLLIALTARSVPEDPAWRVFEGPPNAAERSRQPTVVLDAPDGDKRLVLRGLDVIAAPSADALATRLRRQHPADGFYRRAPRTGWRRVGLPVDTEVRDPRRLLVLWSDNEVVSITDDGGSTLRLAARHWRGSYRSGYPVRVRVARGGNTIELIEPDGRYTRLTSSLELLADSQQPRIERLALAFQLWAILLGFWLIARRWRLPGVVTCSVALGLLACVIGLLP